VLGRVEVVEQPLGVGRQHPPVPDVLRRVGLLGRPGEQLDGAQRVGVQGEDIALVVHHAGVEQSHRRLVAHDLDVEAAPPGQVEQPLAQLGRARAGVRAAQVGVALLLVAQLGAALGAVRRHDEGTLGAVAQATTGPTISGMTSPALRSTTVSPISTPLRSTSDPLCRVAISTVDPDTLTGSITPKGVTRPVRPTFTRMSSSLVLTSSGGYLNAMAHRGARLVEPSRRCRARSSTFTTTPSISCSTSWRCSP